MSLYAAFTKNELTPEQIGDIRAVIKPSSYLPAGLRVQLIDGEFHLADDFGMLGRTRVLDVALTLIATGQGARELLGMTLDMGLPERRGYSEREEDDEPELPPIAEVVLPPGAKARALALREAMRDRQAAAGGVPVDHAVEGGAVRQIGEGDGDVMKG